MCSAVGSGSTGEDNAKELHEGSERDRSDQRQRRRRQGQPTPPKRALHCDAKQSDVEQ